MALIDREYTNTHKKVVIDVDYQQDSIVYCGFLSNNNPRLTQQSLFSIDFANNRLNLHNAPSDGISSVYEYASFTPITIGSIYRLEVTCPEIGAIHLRLLNGTTYELLAEITKSYIVSASPYGIAFEKPFIFSSATGTIVRRFQVVAEYSKTPILGILGDSISQGYNATEEQYSFASLTASLLGENNVIKSGRSGGDYSNVLALIDSEMSILKPEYVMVTIGTNGGNNISRLTSIIDAITALGCKAILNHIPALSNSSQSIAENEQIDYVLSTRPDTLCVKFDIATSTNYNVASGQDADAFASDRLHPNNIGHQRMFKRMLIDLPEIL
jgi:lysophospholipase L1-like esterase